MVDGETTTGGKAETSPEEQERILTEYISDNTQYEGLIITIEDDTTDGLWAEFFAEVNAKRKEREAWFEEILAPLNEAIKKTHAKRHLACDKLKEVEDIITKARGGWLQVKLAATKEANTQALLEAGEKLIAVLQPKPGQTVHTSSGVSVGLAKQPSWRLTDDPTMTAKHTENEKIEFCRTDPRLSNVPDKAFFLKRGMIMTLIKSGDMPAGEHSIEKFDDYRSTSK